MKDNTIITISLIIISLIVIFGGNLGISVSGGVEKPEISNSEPGLLSIFSWAWTGIKFFFAMIAFQVPGMPVWISSIFDIMIILCIWILLKWVRGTEGT